MNVRFLPIAAAAALATSAQAEPQQAKQKAPVTAQAHPAAVIIASAEQAVHQAAASSPATPAPKHRAMRVTTCRCGDPRAETEEQQ